MIWFNLDTCRYYTLFDNQLRCYQTFEAASSFYILKIHPKLF